MLQVPILSCINTPTRAVSGGGGDRNAPEQMAVEQMHCKGDVAARSLIEAALKYASHQIHILHPGFREKIKEASADVARETGQAVVFHEIDNKRFKGLP